MGIKFGALAAMLAMSMGAAQAQDALTGMGSELYVLSSPSDRVSLGGAGLNFNKSGFAHAFTLKMQMLADSRFGAIPSTEFGIGLKMAGGYRADVSVVGLDGFGLGYAPIPSLAANSFGIVQHAEPSAALVSAYFDFAKPDIAYLAKARAYVGGSVGYAYGVGPIYAGEQGYDSASRLGMAWGLGAGVGYDVSPTLKLDASYRYLELGRQAAGFGLTEPYGLRGYSLRLGVIKVFD